MARTIPLFFATPPLIATWGLYPTRAARPDTFFATEAWMPARMSSTFSSEDNREITSDSANTAQVLLMDTGFWDFSESLPISSTCTSRTRDMASRNLPVPAAHLSFIIKFSRFPLSSRSSALASCPPMSITVQTRGHRNRIPFP